MMQRRSDTTLALVSDLASRREIRESSNSAEYNNTMRVPSTNRSPS
jgi:hypothetical protein